MGHKIRSPRKQSAHKTLNIKNRWNAADSRSKCNSQTKRFIVTKNASTSPTFGQAIFWLPCSSRNVFSELVVRDQCNGTFLKVQKRNFWICISSFMGKLHPNWYWELEMKSLSNQTSPWLNCNYLVLMIIFALILSKCAQIKLVSAKLSQIWQTFFQTSRKWDITWRHRPSELTNN